MQKKNPIIVGLLLVVLIGFILAAPILITQMFVLKPGPLAVGVNNMDNIEHNVTVEIFDSNSVSVFNESYSLGPGDRTGLRYIREDLGMYRLEVTLDHEIRRTHMAEIRYERGVSGSDLVHVNVLNSTENPIEFGIAVP